MQAKYGLPEVENGRSEIWPSAQCLRWKRIQKIELLQLSDSFLVSCQGKCMNTTSQAHKRMRMVLSCTIHLGSERQRYMFI